MPEGRESPGRRPKKHPTFNVPATTPLVQQQHSTPPPQPKVTTREWGHHFARVAAYLSVQSPRAIRTMQTRQRWGALLGATSRVKRKCRLFQYIALRVLCCWCCFCLFFCVQPCGPPGEVANSGHPGCLSAQAGLVWDGFGWCPAKPGAKQSDGPNE